MGRDIDMRSGKIKCKEFKIPTTLPPKPFEGAIYFNTSDSKIYVYISGGWVSTAALT